MIRILLADDHQMFIDGIKAFLENEPSIKVVGEALNGHQVLEFLKEQEVDILVLDISMPQMDGHETIKKLKVSHPNTKVLVVSTHGDGENIHKMLTNGANGYLIKNKSKEELVTAIQNIYNGNPYISLDILDTYIQFNTKTQTKLNIYLTNKELEVIKLIAKGLQDKEIADSLDISETTVYTHSRNLRKKIGVTNRTELAIYARENGII